MNAKNRALGAMAGAALAVGAGLWMERAATQERPKAAMAEVKPAARAKRASSTSRGIETQVLGFITNCNPMLFAKEQSASTNSATRLADHAEWGRKAIFSFHRLTATPTEHTLTFFPLEADGGGWNTAYPTASAKEEATNELVTAGIAVKLFAGNYPTNDVLPALGWLCYVTNGFWTVGEVQTDFANVKGLKGCWLYR